MPRVNTVKSARKDYPEYGIKKGETYYWWKFNYGGKRVSKTYPKPQQLTNSSYQIALYDISDMIAETSELSDQGAVESWIESIKEAVQELLDSTQESLDNMPESLRESSASGELLQERIDALENAISDLENIDTNYEEDSDFDEYLENIISEVQMVDIS